MPQLTPLLPRTVATQGMWAESAPLLGECRRGGGGSCTFGSERPKAICNPDHVVKPPKR